MVTTLENHSTEEQGVNEDFKSEKDIKDRRVDGVFSRCSKNSKYGEKDHTCYSQDENAGLKVLPSLLSELFPTFTLIVEQQDRYFASSSSRFGGFEEGDFFEVTVMIFIVGGRNQTDQPDFLGFYSTSFNGNADSAGF